LLLKQSNKETIYRRISPVRTLARPDEWAIYMGLRVDGRPFSLEGREFVSQVIRDMSPEIVIPKAAQMSFTVTFITRTLHWIKERGWHHLYLLPMKTGAIPFVQARIDPTIDSNEFLREHFTNVDNRLHKQNVNGVSLYIRGTNINRELQEIPVDVEVWDERDRMVEDSLEDARHRMDGSKIKKLVILSTPTVPGHGVDSDDEWHSSDQHRWEIPCPRCNRYQTLDFEESVKLGDAVSECVLECKFCHRPIKDQERIAQNALGRWVSTNLNGIKRGYHINQFNSPVQTLNDILKGWFSGQKDTKKLKSFYNNSLGLPWVAYGDQITPEIIDKCRSKGHRLGGIPDGPVFIGVDIGTFIHVKASYLNRFGHKMAWQLHIFREWDQLDNFLSKLISFNCVIDAHPEKRNARDLALKYPGKVWLGFEEDRPATEEIAVYYPAKSRTEVGKVLIDRTMAFDQVISDYLGGRIVLPADARELGEYLERKDYNGFYYHLIQMVRTEEEDTKGRVVARWRKNKNPDHWHHTEMFETIATMRRPSLEVPVSIQEAFQKSAVMA